MPTDGTKYQLLLSGGCFFLQVNAEILTEEGDAKTAICNVVEKLNIGMLVLGDRGLGKIKRLAFLTFF